MHIILMLLFSEKSKTRNNDRQGKRELRFRILNYGKFANHFLILGCYLALRMYFKSALTAYWAICPHAQRSQPMRTGIKPQHTIGALNLLPCVMMSCGFASSQALYIVGYWLWGRKRRCFFRQKRL